MARFQATIRPARLIVVVVGTLFLLAGCGDGDDGSATSSTATITTTTLPTTSTSAATTATSTTGSTTGGSTTSGPQAGGVEVFFSVGDGSDCAEVEPFPRAVDDDVEPIGAAFEELVSGPTDDEVAAGAGSFFSTATSEVVASVTVSGDLLIVDFTDLRSQLPNASTSCGSAALLAQLTSTAFQFDRIERARFTIDGSCSQFANWLQRECFDTDRQGRAVDIPLNEQATGSGCTPPPGDGLPAGRWFGFVDDADDQSLSFDLACWFTGTSAAAAAAEDGEESPPPNDYHIRNAVDRLRTMAVAPATEVLWLPNPGDPAGAELVSYADWLTGRSTRSYQPGIWVIVTDDRITAVEEQYVP